MVRDNAYAGAKSKILRFSIVHPDFEFGKDEMPLRCRDRGHDGAIHFCDPGQNLEAKNGLSIFTVAAGKSVSQVRCGQFF